ncbi:NAD-dependent epimerase/dehydratase family protein [Candidatus Kaiserbacteria bacterium]|nr:NAD-dependent epimerase/dehydratase family protein [Candidatus Kaiserbacteria bacterium]
MKALITGGAGFAGYHLARLLVDMGYEVVLADDLSRGKKDHDLLQLLKNPRVTLVEVDLVDRSVWRLLGEGYDHVYHLASVNGTKLFYEVPHEVLRVGILTSLHAIDWFCNDNGKRDAKIVYASSTEAYAGTLEAFGELPLPTPEDVPLVIADPYNPRWSYAGQKLIGEQLFINFAAKKGFRMGIVRPNNIYGPRAGYEHAIPGIIQRIEMKEEPFMIYGAEETRSFCYIEDAVEGMRRVMESAKTDNATYHVGASEETKISDLTEMLFELAAWRPKGIEAKSSPPGSVKRRLPDVSKIERDTGWRASTNLREGLQRTLTWYQAHPQGS